MKRLLNLRTVGRSMDYLRASSSPHPGLFVMLLSNLTVLEAGTEQLLQLGSTNLAGFNMCALDSALTYYNCVSLACTPQLGHVPP